MFFKGYVETKNKKCIEKFKNRTDFKTYEQIKNLNEFAGILAEDTILIDVDDYETSEILFEIIKQKQLKCRVYATTRGKHFLFKNTTVDRCKTHTSLAIGIESDIKIGKNNSYSILKFNGAERKILYDITENEEADPLPKWMIPIKTKMEFLYMEKGDGRNQALFNYILTLQSNDFSVEEARETIRIINSFMLKEPLSDNELEVVLRDEAFAKPVFFKGNTFLFDKFAVFLKNNHHIIKINNQLHLYKDGIYVPGQDEIEAVMIKHIPQLNRAKRTEVMAYLDILIRENTPPTDANLIAFRNGLYNILDDSFVPFTHEHVITNKIEYDYNPNAYCKLTDDTLNKMSCNDPAIRSLMEEMVGYTFYRRNEIGKFFILTGEKNNGKSTFLDMIVTLLGANNTAALDLKELSERFKTAELFGKLANIGDDIGDEFVANTGVLKKLVTGDRMNVERKGQNPFDFNNYSKLLFSANNIPRMGKGKDSAALLRRIVIIPFDAKFSKSDPDFQPLIKYKLREQSSMEYLIQLGIKGLKRVLENNGFTESEKVQKSIDEYEETNNPIISFFKEIDVSEIENEPTNEIYKKYQEFCISTSLQAISAGEFTKQVKSYFNLEVVNKKIKGKKYRIFVSK
ncbi:DNA primase family protein [[Eubacterium] hominis]|uniref:DNA primase family protein n=1 Tax=[Eubacterium] hominis TaxID=2764325 RepID=UPI0022E388EB